MSALSHIFKLYFILKYRSTTRVKEEIRSSQFFRYKRAHWSSGERYLSQGDQVGEDTDGQASSTLQCLSMVNI
jgi:hypothetical protein